jgi:hypothetical protein
VSVAVTNATAAAGKVTGAIVDQDGVLLKRRQSDSPWNSSLGTTEAPGVPPFVTTGV